MTQFNTEARLVLARCGMDDHENRELVNQIEAAIADSYSAAIRDVELTITTWGDITPANKRFILGRLRRD